jgi:farnesyl diphosphate synthase
MSILGLVVAVESLEHAKSVIAVAQQLIQQDLQHVLDHYPLVSPLKDAVHHAVMLGGKRVRPALTYATAHIKTSDIPASARRAAVAVELIHCYSLIHDDLPCMDDDALRRGQPTVHILYGEANAMLAGDVLQSMAFDILTSDFFSTDSNLDLLVAAQQVQVLAKASSQMVVGQTLDLAAEQRQINEQELESIHLNKTGALIQAAIAMGALSVGVAKGSTEYQALLEYGRSLGLAFQVQDDVLDITATTDQLGKPAQSDVKLQKSTYPALMGLDGAQRYAVALHTQAIDALAVFAEQASSLKKIAYFLLKRVN